MRNRGRLVSYIFWGLCILAIAVTIGNTRPVNGQYQISLEQRVENLEQEVIALKWSNLQFQAQSAGGYAAALYSGNTYRIVFEQDLSWRKAHVPVDPNKNISIYPYVCGLCRIGDYKHITLYDLDGNQLDNYDFSNVIQSGDLLVSWFSATKPTGIGPGTLNIYPYYWNPKTGLAVGFLKLDGSSRMNW